MPTTPRGYHYPALTDAPNGPVQIQQLATDIDTDVTKASLGSYGETIDGSAVTLSTTSAFAGAATRTFNLTSQRRVRIVTQTRFQLAAGTSARYLLQSAYNAGSSASIGSATTVGTAASQVLSIIGVNGSGTLMQEGTALLAAGTYTAYPSVTRAANGSTTDVATGFYVAVYDAGSV